jgi:hypothetical protein
MAKAMPTIVAVDVSERLTTIAALLATGLVRLHSRTALTSQKRDENLQQSAVQGLEIEPETVLSVHTG